MDFPKDRKYQKTHEWVQFDGDFITVGISDYAQDELGDIVFIELPEKGKELKKGDEIAAIESVKTASSIYAPCDGTITETNSDLEEEPEKINKDPYGTFIVTMKISGNCGDSDLLDADAYQEVVEQEKQD